MAAHRALWPTPPLLVVRGPAHLVDRAARFLPQPKLGGACAWFSVT